MTFFKAPLQVYKLTSKRQIQSNIHVSNFSMLPLSCDQNKVSQAHGKQLSEANPGLS